MTTPDQPRDRPLRARLVTGGPIRLTPHVPEPPSMRYELTQADVDAAYERGVAEGRRQATEGLTLQHEDEQWSVWWHAPGGGLNVTVPTDEEADHETVCRAFQAEHGGEVKRRRRVTLVGPWEADEQAGPTLSQDPVARRLGIVDAEGRVVCHCQPGQCDGHAEQAKPTCTCPDIDVTTALERPGSVTVKGYDRACRVCPNPYAEQAGGDR